MTDNRTEEVTESRSVRYRRTLVLMLASLGLVVLICGGLIFVVRLILQGERNEPTAVLEGASVSTVMELDDEDAHPHAVAVRYLSNGGYEIFAGSFCTGEIWRITSDGESELWLEGGEDIGAVSGMAFGPDGDLFVADRGDCDASEGSASLKRISPDGSTVERIGDIGREDVPNAVAFDREGVLYLTDTRHRNVRRMNLRNELETWWELPEVDGNEAQPTGLAYDPLTDTMIVADTETGSIYRVGFQGSDRSAVQQDLLYREDQRELDGLTVDDEGRVIFTLFDVNKVARLETDGQVNILAEGFREPSDVVYVDNRVYVSNFDGLSLAPLIGWLIEPSLPFTVDVIQLPETDEEVTIQ
jgi:DNA-binding beta-propeller fold protein YncE